MALHEMAARLVDGEEHGWNRDPKGEFTITADGVVSWRGVPVGTLSVKALVVPHPEDRWGKPTVEIVSHGMDVDHGTIFGSSIASGGADFVTTEAWEEMAR